MSIISLAEALDDWLSAHVIDDQISTQTAEAWSANESKVFASGLLEELVGANNVFESFIEGDIVFKSWNGLLSPLSQEDQKVVEELDQVGFRTYHVVETELTDDNDAEIRVTNYLIVPKNYSCFFSIMKMLTTNGILEIKDEDYASEIFCTLARKSLLDLADFDSTEGKGVTFVYSINGMTDTNEFTVAAFNRTENGQLKDWYFSRLMDDIKEDKDMYEHENEDENEKENDDEEEYEYEDSSEDDDVEDDERRL